jgi:hypothetical protein
MRSTVLSILPLLCSALAPLPALAQDQSPVPACPEGNVLARKSPSHWQDVRRELSLLTDEAVTPEGAMWDSQPAVILDTAASTVTWDLGTVTLIRALVLQADANDTYTIWGSIDGKEYKIFGQIDPVPNHGLRTRTLNIGDMTARYLRVGEGVGDSFYSISEMAAYCQIPATFPPNFKVVDAPVAAVPPKKLLDYWDVDGSAWWELVLACLGLAFLWWEKKLGDKGKTGVKRRLRTVLLATMGVLAFFTYFNFGSFHFSSFVHGWDTFHYYVGSKYFKELSYERLYECVAVADGEEPNLRRRVDLR